MTNQLNMVQHDEFGKLEILVIDNKPFFPATECAKILGYSNPHKAIADHCRSLTKREVPHPQSPNRTIFVNFIPEGDLYRLIVRSKLPAAERFERWVFDEVLPSIREHGAYITEEQLDNLLRDPNLTFELFRKLKDEREKRTALECKLEIQAPKVRYYDIILQCKNAVPVSLIAKDYGMSAKAFNLLLHNLGIQYKVGPAWLLYQKYCGKGYTASRTYYTVAGTAVLHTCWTQKGRLFLYDTLACYGIYPSMVETEAAFH